MSPGRRGRSVTVTAVGHPAIRASHDKTLELTADAAITPRATCVAGVSAAFSAEALAQLRGRVSFVIEAAGRRAGGTAVINPEHTVTDRFVIRRSRHADAGTLAVAATAAAADLPRELAATLAEPDHRVTFTVTEEHPPPPLVILAAMEPPGRLGVLWRTAEADVDLDAGRQSRGRPSSGRPASAVDAVTLDAAVRAVIERGGTVRARSPQPPEDLGPAAVARLHELVAGGARLACPTHPSAAALLAAGLSPTPALHLGRVTGRRLRQPDLEQLVALTPTPIVFGAPAEEAEDVATWLRDRVPLRRCWADDAAVDLGLALVPFDAASDLRHRWPDGPVDDGDRLFVVGPAPGGGRAVDLDAVVLYLVDAGVPGRQIADALRPLGLRRSEIYRIVGDQPGPAPG